MGITDPNPEYTFRDLIPGEEYIFYVSSEGQACEEQSRNQRTSKPSHLAAIRFHISLVVTVESVDIDV